MYAAGKAIKIDWGETWDADRKIDTFCCHLLVLSLSNTREPYFYTD
jgi:hypothetical protein